MKDVVIIGVTMVMLVVAGSIRGEDCGIVNGSFEDDSSITDITAREPNGWSVEMPAGKFTGHVLSEWPQGGKYNLTLESGYWATFEAGDMATVSQEINLAVVRQINFDLKLDDFGMGGWDPNMCTALVLIDDEVVWDSTSAGLVANGSYPGQVCITADEKFRTGDPHKLSLGIRVEVSDRIRGRYITHWDVVDCNLYCGGAGPVEGDIDGDCCVDANDLKILADMWLADAVDPNDPANLSHDGDELTSFATIDFRDFAVYAGGWDGTLFGLEGLCEFWLAIVDPDYEYNLFTEDDIRPSGLINFLDLAVLGSNWLECSVVDESVVDE